MLGARNTLFIFEATRPGQALYLSELGYSCIYRPYTYTMVLVLDGSSEYDSPVWTELGKLTWSRHLFTPKSAFNNYI